MSAQDCNVAAVEIPNPEYYPSNLPVNPLNDTVGFRRDYSTRITTLSTNNPGQWDSIKGLLFVPEFSATDVCDKYTRSLIPANVTRYNDLPPNGWATVTLAPWTSAHCVQSYLAQTRANPFAIAAIFYQPNQNGGELTAPSASDGSWDIGDGGKWKQNPFPIFALPGGIGAALMHELSLYSGNMSSVPHGAQLVKEYDSRDYVRLLTEMDLDSSSSIPSLWVFLIIVLAILLALVLLSSCSMHILQASRRRSLQRRIQRGEVDLEGLGIKRLNVPQSVINQMPHYLYRSKQEPGSSTATPVPDTAAATKSAQPDYAREVAFSQPTCPICLDDFIQDETMVRELPCNHIFHPECIDPFLKDNSSLCPMCKKSSLPQGYMPVRVTNLMVRRERMISRMRSRRSQDQEQRSNRLANSRRLSTAIGGLTHRMRLTQSGPVRRSLSAGAAGAGDPRPSERDVTELASVSPPPAVAGGAVVEVDAEPPTEVQRQGTSARREWRRERLARAQRESFQERSRELEDHRPKWRRRLGKVLPFLD